MVGAPSTKHEKGSTILQPSPSEIKQFSDQDGFHNMNIYMYSQARWGATSVSVHYDLTLPNVSVTKRPSNKLNQINHERIPSKYPSRDPHNDFGGFF